ncbi:MAG: AraC family transcriptional regulator ligand-binding domain-containing protein [Pseudomonadota bacterium]
MPEKRTIRATDPAGAQQSERGRAHVGLASTVVAFAFARGMPPGDIEAATGMDLAQLGQPDARIPDEVVPRLWNALSAAEPDSPITLEAARGAPFSTLGGLTHGMQYASSLRQAVDFSRRNRQVLSDRLEIHVEERAGEAFIIGNHPADAIDLGCTAEFGLAILVRFLRDVMGLGSEIRRVELVYGPRGPAAAYERFYHCPVRFHAPDTAVVVRPEALDLAVRMAEPSLFAFVEEHFAIVRQQLETVNQRDELLVLHRALADCAAASDYRAEAVARRAQLTLRQAQRLAAGQGTTLSRLIEAARRANAEAFLADSTLSIQMVAALLGYSEDRAFRRAFKRWTGKSPRAFRQGH